jgi:hypothetical protein
MWSEPSKIRSNYRKFRGTEKTRENGQTEEAFRILRKSD